MSIEFLEDLKRQWMAMIDAIDDPLALVNSKFEIVRQNKAFAQRSLQSEIPITAFRGKRCYEVFAGRTSPCAHCKLGQIEKSKDDGVTWETSELFPESVFNIRMRKITSAGEGLFVVHYSDITQQKMMQEQLAQSDKLAALGKLSGGVAHEINSPLAGILAFSQMVLKEMDEEDPHHADLKEIEDAARKCKVIVEGLLGFSRQEPTAEMAPTCLFEAVRSTLRLAQAILRKHRIDCHTNFSQQNAMVYGSSGKLGQVFLNLITNAIYAMKEGGSLSVVGEIEGQYAKVSVSDSGRAACD